MSKELEIMEEEREWLVEQDYADSYMEECDLVLKALHRLESIDNSNPSEALKCSLNLYKMVESAGNGNGFSLNEAWKYHTTIEQALLKAQEQEKELDRYKVLEKELKSEINVLFSYMEFTKLFFEIFNLNYSNETFTLSLKPNEQYNIENVDLKICLIKEDADKILKVAELLEKEVEE